MRRAVSGRRRLAGTAHNAGRRRFTWAAPQGLSFRPVGAPEPRRRECGSSTAQCFICKIHRTVTRPAARIRWLPSVLRCRVARLHRRPPTLPQARVRRRVRLPLRHPSVARRSPRIQTRSLRRRAGWARRRSAGIVRNARGQRCTSAAHRAFSFRLAAAPEVRQQESGSRTVRCFTCRTPPAVPRPAARTPWRR